MRWYFAAGGNDQINVLLDEKVKSILISFAHFKKGVPERLAKAAAKGSVRVMADSGAFTNATKPGSVTLDAYHAFLKANSKWLDEYVTLDNLFKRAETLKNTAALRKAGMKPMIVDHMWFPHSPNFDPEYKAGSKLCWGGLVSMPSFVGDKKLSAEKLVQRLKHRAGLVRNKPASSVHLLGVGMRLRGFAEWMDFVDSFDTASWRIASSKFGKVPWVSVRDDGWPQLHTPHYREMPDKLKAKVKQWGLDVSQERDRNVIAVRAFKVFFRLSEDRFNRGKEKGEDFAAVSKAVMDDWDDMSPDFPCEEFELLFSSMSEEQMAECLEQIAEDKSDAAVSKAVTVQSVILSKEKFDSFDKAKKWVKDHGFKTSFEGKGVDETETSYRFRQRDPADFDKLRTISLTDGVKAVAGPLKGSTSKLFKLQETDRLYAVFGGETYALKLDDTEPAAEEPKEEELELSFLPIDKKAPEDRQIILAEVLVPDEVDAHKDTIDAPTIELAAHRWLAKYQNRGVMHTKIVNSKIEIYESYVTLADITIGGRKVKKGTWLMMLHIVDNELWQKVKKGELTGLSMGGFARRTKV